MKYKLLGIIFIFGIILGLFACTDKESVKINSSDEAIEKFENKDSFILIIGDSLCSSCQEYKDDTVIKYVEKHTQEDLIFLYTDKSFANTTELSNFLTDYGIDYEGSPSTYYIKNGIYTQSNVDEKTKFEGYKTLEQLETFISENKASN